MEWEEKTWIDFATQGFGKWLRGSSSIERKRRSCMWCKSQNSKRKIRDEFPPLYPHVKTTNNEDATQKDFFFEPCDLCAKWCTVLAVLSRRVQLHTPLIHPFWKESLASFPSRNFQMERLCVHGPLLGRPHQQMPNKWKRILRGKPVHGCCLIMSLAILVFGKNLE